MALVQEEADDNELESNSIENDNDDSNGQSDSGKYSIVCINNNNNVVIGEDIELTCADCFTKVLSDEELDDLIQAIENDGGPASLQELCDFIAGDLSEDGRRTRIYK